jgi:hypothetical protein
VRNKLLENKISNESFKGLVLALKDIEFKFIHIISDELPNNKTVKGRVLEQLFFLID